jgi:hypothetical protein
MTVARTYFGSRCLALPAVILLSALLCACATDDSSTDRAARFLVAPGKYTIYDCAQLAEVSKTKAERQHELEGLMAKASASSGGRVVNAIAYQPEYLSLRGEMMDLRQAAVDKKCNFVPGEPHARTISSRQIR